MLNKVTQVNKTDTFFLFSKLFCVMDITKKVNHPEYGVWLIYDNYVCENVLDESDKVDCTESEILEIFNNTEAYAFT